MVHINLYLYNPHQSSIEFFTLSPQHKYGNIANIFGRAIHNLNDW